MFALLLGCSATPNAIRTVRFANAPPVTAVDDRRDVATKPSPRTTYRALYNLDGQVVDPIHRALAFETPQRALGVNSIDEVPDSTWFTNRIGVREIAPDELRVMPDGIGNPELHTPWTIRSTKVGGQSTGFIITDARGVKFLLKFDTRGVPEAETAAHIITGRLLWAAGYNVTDDYIAYIRREDLAIAPDAVKEDVLGHKQRLDRAAVDRMLASIEIDRDGRIRTMVSRMLDGKAIGSHPGQGTRGDDPNDRIAHERRRDLRGAFSIFAWLDHVDVQQGQMLDMWIKDPADPKRHYVKHYLVDYGMSLGVMARVSHNLRRSYEYYLDAPVIAGSLLTFGLGPDRIWKRRQAPDFRGLGVFETTAFAPGAWKPTSPSYLPFVDADRFDKFWGAKIVMRFTRAQLRAAVDAARLSDPRTADYLVDALVTRQRALGAYWFARVNPLDKFEATPDGVCFDDLMLVHGLAPTSDTRYTVQPHDRDGRRLGAPSVVAATGRTCVRTELAGGDGYTVIRIATARPGIAGVTDVHVARDPTTKTMRVIGVWRP
jgi:hypothetical protein